MSSSDTGGGRSENSHENQDPQWLASLLKALKPVVTITMAQIVEIIEKGYSKVPIRITDFEDRVHAADQLRRKGDADLRSDRAGERALVCVQRYLCGGYFVDFDPSQLREMTLKQRLGVLEVRSWIAFGLCGCLAANFNQTYVDSVEQADTIYQALLDLVLPTLAEAARDDEVFSVFTKRASGRQLLALLYGRAADASEGLRKYEQGVMFAKKSLAFSDTKDQLYALTAARLVRCERHVKQTQSGR